MYTRSKFLLFTINKKRLLLADKQILLVQKAGKEMDRRITLSLRDLRHLQLQFVKNATQKLDLYLPTTESGDPLKARVQELVNDFIYDIFDSAKGSLVIDGVDENQNLRKLLENPANETEPFDFSLQDQVRKLYQQVEDETISLTKLRRETPGSLKRRYEESFNESMEQLKKLDNDDTEDDEVDTQKEQAFERDVKQRLGDVVKGYENSLKDLKSLKDNIPTERGELDRIRQLGQFLVDEQ